MSSYNLWLIRHGINNGSTYIRTPNFEVEDSLEEKSKNYRETIVANNNYPGSCQPKWTHGLLYTPSTFMEQIFSNNLLVFKMRDAKIVNDCDLLFYLWSTV